MDLKEYEALMDEKFVGIEEDHIKDLFSVSITENGWQWRMVLRARKEHCNIIIDAYKRIGYKLKEDSA